MFAASRLGRRPKRLKEAQESSHHPTRTTPIAPYPPLSPQQLSRLSMAELQRLLQSLNGSQASHLNLQQQIFKLEQAQAGGQGQGQAGPQGEHPAHGGGDEGYASQGAESPSSSKSHSPASAPGSAGVYQPRPGEPQVPGNIYIKQEQGVDCQSGNGNCMMGQYQNPPADGSMVGMAPQGDMTYGDQYMNHNANPAGGNYIASLSSLSLSISSKVLGDTQLSPQPQGGPPPQPNSQLMPPAQVQPSLNQHYDPTRQPGQPQYQRQISQPQCPPTNVPPSHLPSQGGAQNYPTKDSQSMSSYLDPNLHQHNLNMRNNMNSMGQMPAPPVIGDTHSQSTNNVDDNSNLPQVKSETNFVPCAFSNTWSQGAANAEPQNTPDVNLNSPDIKGVETKTLMLLNSMIQEAKLIPGKERALLLEQVADTIEEQHLNTCNYTVPKLEVGMSKYREIVASKPDGQVSVMSARP